MERNDLGEIYNKKNYIKFGGVAKKNGKHTPIQLTEEETKIVEKWDKQRVYHVFTTAPGTYHFTVKT